MQLFSDRHPLACGQRWLLHVARSSPALARPVQRVYRLFPPADTAAVLAAFRRVVDRHDPLRLRIIETDEGWRQEFPAHEASIAGLSIRGATAEHRRAYLQRELLQHGRAPIDPLREPPYRARMFEIDGEYFLSLCIDHLAADELGFDRFEHELAHAYWEERSGVCLARADGEPRSPFLDYLARESSRAPQEAENLEYWRAHLAGVPLGPPDTKEIAWVPGAAARCRLKDASFARFDRACRARACSIFAAVLAAQARLLTELGGAPEQILNVPVSNRIEAADHCIVGNLSTLLHVRLRPDPGELAAATLVRVRNQLFEAMAHRHHDYGALSALVAAEAATRGGHVHWMTGCNYIVERSPPGTNVPAFFERINPDTVHGTPVRLAVPRAAFTLSCRRRHAAASFEFEWDPIAWPLTPDALPGRFLEILSELVACDLLADPSSAP